MDTILQLSNGQQVLYDLFYQEMDKGSYNIKLPLSTPKKSIILFIKLVLGEHPELINYDNCCAHFGSLGLYNYVKLQPVFSKTDAYIAQKHFDEETKKILQQIIKPRTNLIQKALAIHDYLASNVAYDEDLLYRRKTSILSHTAYGAIVEKKAVCEGISYAFSHLAKQVGISVTVVNGFAEGEEHAWNMIQIGQDCYHIDVTWDIKNRRESPIKSYDYFCLCDDDLKSRNWDKKIYPRCMSSKYNYFTVTGSFAHNKQQLRNIILKQFSTHKMLYFKYDFLNMSNSDTVEYLWKELLDVAKKNDLRVGNVTVSLNEEQKIFLLYSKES